MELCFFLKKVIIMDEEFEFVNNIICPHCNKLLELHDVNSWNSEFHCNDLWIEFHDKQYFDNMYYRGVMYLSNKLLYNGKDYIDELNLTKLNYQEIYDNYSLQEGGQIFVNVGWKNIDYFVKNYGMFM